MTKAAERLGKSRTAFAVLGFLAGAPRSGYEIKKAIERSTSYFWNESFGQIYPILQKLEAEGLAECLGAETHGRRKSRKYAITETGREALRDWLAAPVSGAGIRNEHMLKLFFGRHVAPEVSIAHLSDYRRQLTHDLATFEAFRAGYEDAIRAGRTSKTLIYVLAPLDFGIRGARSQIEWCDETIRALEALRES
ncbi:PadR family transcriptional regulator [Sphingosinicella soli]|uniref:DNA-binding PadR family transcriptional regulator n=1 Tax=Sphingosinicella soli TaxID=333708 RepID=A0A7W7AYZ6_9SPHN|nr:PadR family transcriptional regulator [Sphingosinicella soli]MBB4630961.1 DNA-binding PadR family transcriptional regulator [Sphingosinicella soli]